MLITETHPRRLSLRAIRKSPRVAVEYFVISFNRFDTKSKFEGRVESETGATSLECTDFPVNQGWGPCRTHSHTISSIKTIKQVRPTFGGNKEALLVFDGATIERSVAWSPSLDPDADVRFRPRINGFLPSPFAPETHGVEDVYGVRLVVESDGEIREEVYATLAWDGYDAIAQVARSVTAQKRVTFICGEVFKPEWSNLNPLVFKIRRASTWSVDDYIATFIA